MILELTNNDIDLLYSALDYMQLNSDTELESNQYSDLLCKINDIVNKE
jgi:hypothetical protein